MLADCPRKNMESNGLCDILIVVCSFVTFSLGILIIVGWWSENLALTQVFPNLSPMQYNAALAFSLVGLSLLLFSRNRYVSLICGIAIFSLGILTLAEYIFNIQIGIDQLFMKQTIGLETYPGRLPSNTAACFLLTGLALIMMQRLFVTKLQGLIVNILGLFIVMLGLVALLGHAADIPSNSSWGNFTSMAVHTSFGFIFTGIGICASAWREGISTKTSMHIYMPIITIITGTLMFIILWQSLLHKEYQHVGKSLDNEMSDVQQKINLDLNSHAHSLALLQNTWELRGTTPQPHWLRQTNINRQLSQQYTAIASLGKNLQLHWLANYTKNNPSILRESIAACAAHLKTFGQLRQTRLLFGNNNFACIAVPLKTNNTTASYIFGLVNLKKLFTRILATNEAVGFGVRVSGSQYLYYKSITPYPNIDAKQWINTSRINLLGSVLNLEIWPSEKILENELSRYPLITLVAGLFITLLLAFIFRLWLITKKGKELVQQAKEDLEAEVTQRTTTERQLRDLKKRYSLILSSAGEGIYGIDTEGKTTFVNPAAGELLGWKPKDLIGIDHHSMIHHQRGDKSKYPAAESPIIKTLRDGQVQQVDDEVFWRKDGKCIPVQYTCTPIIEDGHVTGAVVTFNDISDRIRSEQQLKSYAQDLKNSNKELDDFAYIASHDLQEPLRGIHNYSAFLLEDYETKLDDAGKYKLQTLMRLSKRLQLLLNNLLTYSKVGRLELAIGPCDLNKTVDSTLDLLKSRLDEEGVKVHKANTLPTIICDNARIGEVFMNLISNALKYNDKAEKRLEIGSYNGADPLQPNSPIMPIVYVKDNGIGIKEQNLTDVFTIFRRLHSQDKFGGGTGFGLTITKKIIERHNGHIWVESTYGQGTTFYLSFPQPLDSFGRIKNSTTPETKIEKEVEQ